MTRDDLLRKWVEALESGRYQQGRSRLKTKNGEFCCLGVLCDISGAGRWKVDADGDSEFRTKGDWSCSLLPNGVLTGSRYQFDEFMEMNDNGASFAAIASAIRQKYADVFTESVV